MKKAIVNSLAALGLCLCANLGFALTTEVEVKPGEDAIFVELWNFASGCHNETLLLKALPDSDDNKTFHITVQPNSKGMPGLITCTAMVSYSGNLAIPLSPSSENRVFKLVTPDSYDAWVYASKLGGSSYPPYSLAE